MKNSTLLDFGPKLLIFLSLFFAFIGICLLVVNSRVLGNTVIPHTLLDQQCDQEVMGKVTSVVTRVVPLTQQVISTIVFKENNGVTHTLKAVRQTDLNFQLNKTVRLKVHGPQICSIL